MSEIDYRKIDWKWQKYWRKTGLYRTPEDPNPSEKFYLLEMYAYPSGDIHIGHFRNYTIGDVMWRYLRMKGRKLLHPFGWDAFGLPAEQAAIKRKIHPEQWTEGNIAKGKSTLEALGISYDWDREVVTCRPDYYKWTQWVFLKLYEKGLTYQAEALVNWCPECNTVLANEQVDAEGMCWRHPGVKVEKKFLKQWYFRITDYAQRLLDGLDELGDNWPASTAAQQRNWIGRSEGAEIRFTVVETGDELPVFTTRPDTIYGVTFMAIAPDAPLMRRLADRCPNRDAVAAYIGQSLRKTEIERTAEGTEKDGVDTGLTVKNPFNGRSVPLYVADYVLAGYGCGAVMAVPAHDERDFAFAGKYGIPIVPVIQPSDRPEPLKPEEMDDAYVAYGVMHDSGPFDGLESAEGIKKTAEHARKQGFGKPTVNYRLRDWLISRQRYWGAPIPVIHCEDCGPLPVPEKDLPVLLPEVEDFIPKGRSPLEDVPEFMSTSCPKCGRDARRDPDTMDTFVCSAWYHLRYSDPRNDRKPWEKQAVDAWLPVDLYIGGSEHAMGHLIYFRFITKVLHDMGYVSCDEPAKVLFHHGMVLDEKGQVMSKSLGNVISPVALMEAWGVDIPRTSMLFLAPPEREILWSDKGMVGAKRFLNRWAALAEKLVEGGGFMDGRVPALPECVSDDDRPYYRRLQQTVKKVTSDIEAIQFNTAIAALMELLNDFADFDAAKSSMAAYAASLMPRLLGPFAPHLAEELWEKAGGKPSVFEAPWPEVDEAACLEDAVEIPVQVKGKVRAVIQVPRGTSREDALSAALADPKLERYVPDRSAVKKVIFVPDKILNLIV